MALIAIEEGIYSQVLETLDRNMSRTAEAIEALDNIQANLERVRHRLAVVEQNLNEADKRGGIFRKKESK